MKSVAIISEYNPFHNGHLYQIEKIREHFGEDAAIIAIMSGNYVQRGDAAILDKWARAEIAASCGVNLVLELPFPYSSSSAEFFASAGVHIVNRLGIVDALSFGSESGELDTLLEVAKNSLTPEFVSMIKTSTQNDEFQASGYPSMLASAYKKAFSSTFAFDKPNNILAIEYLKALLKTGSSVIPHTIKRSGGDYNSVSIVKSNRQSATAIRTLLSEDLFSASDYIPKSAFDVMLREYNTKSFPCTSEKISSAVLTHLRLSDRDIDAEIHDAAGGLYNRLVNKSSEATSISSLIDLAGTKKYTTARIKRAIWFSLFGVTSSDLRELPEYTQVLAMDKIGQDLLKKIKKTSSFTILTKPSRKPESELAKRQKLLSDKADAVFQLMKPSECPATSIYKRTPFIKI